MVQGTPTAAKKMLNSLQMSHFRKKLQGQGRISAFYISKWMKEEEGFKRGLNFSKQFNAAAAREMFE